MKKEYKDLYGQHRQGDIFFEPVKSIPDKPTQLKHGIIARGEVSGHMHRIDPRALQQQKAMLMIAAGIMYLRVKEEIEILHEEHNSIILPTGDWKITRQEEYTPAGWRQVVD